MPNKVLIFRIGSLGDTIVALPALHLIERAYPDAERRLLTNLPVDKGALAAPAPSILEGTGLIDSYISYPVGFKERGALRSLIMELKKWKPDVLLYLMPRRKLSQRIRDRIFFKMCSIPKIVGLSLSKEACQNRCLPEKGIFEPETLRLLRNVSEIGRIDIDEPSSWDLRLSTEELSIAEDMLGRMGGGADVLVCSVGTKQEVNDWGEDNWSALIQSLSDRFSKLGLVLIGSPEEYQKSERLASLWKGGALNLCGKTSPRISAAVLSKAVLFFGHDSGPMHLASAVGTRCVAVFSGRNKPGLWFPVGKSHKILYHETECQGCGRSMCEEHNKKCIRSITVDEVLDMLHDSLCGRRIRG